MQTTIATSTVAALRMPVERSRTTIVRVPRIAFLVILVLGALAVRAHALGRASLWLDEANSWYVAHLSWPELFANLRASPLGPVYFVLLKLWMAVAGESEAALRAPSLIAGIALIPVVYAIGTRTVGERAARIGAALAAISPLHLYFSQEARMYMPLALGGALCTLAYIRWRDAVIDARDARSAHVPLAAFTACAIAILATNVVVAPLVAALDADALLVVWREVPARERRRRARGAWLAANAIVAAGVALTYLTVRSHAAVSSQAWRAPLGVGDALRALLQYPVHAFDGLYFYPDELARAIGDAWHVHGAGEIRRLIVAAIAEPLVVAALVIALARTGPIVRGRARVLLFACLVPLAVATIISMWRQVDLERYVLYASPFLLLAIALGVQRLSPTARAGALATLSAAAVLGTVRTFGVHSRDSDYRPVASALVARSGEAARVIVQPAVMREPLDYYVHDRLHLPIVPVHARAVRAALAGVDAPAWLVLDYRSPLYETPPDSLSAALGGCVLSDVYEAAAVAGVRLVLAEPAAACTPRLTGG